MKINLESWNLAQVSYLKGRWKSHSIFLCDSCHQLSKAVNSCWQLIKNENQPRELKFGTPINFRVYMKILVKFFSYQPSSAVSSFQQLLSAVKSKRSLLSRSRKGSRILKTAFGFLLTGSRIFFFAFGFGRTEIVYSTEISLNFAA